jgi:UDP-glucose 4-epimerase
MRILVTGAHGFLGRHVARNFASAGHIVTGIGHGSWASVDASRFGISRWHTSDVVFDSLVTYAGEPDLIVHCAGSGSVGFSMTHPYQDFARTVNSTAAVLEYIRLYSTGTALIYPSSAAVYGVAARLPINESDLPGPVSPYGVHKLMAEQLCKSYASNHGVSCAIVRFFSLYGEGLKKQLLWDACNRASSGETTFGGTGEELRDWLHVDDAAALVAKAAECASIHCPTINGGSGCAVTVREFLIALFSHFAGSRTPNFSGNPRPGDPPGYHASVVVARELGWTPRISWQEGLRKYVQWFSSGML